MKFCSHCGHPVDYLIPNGDTRPRAVCSQCGSIHYENPRLVVGSIPIWREAQTEKILLCRRAIQPRHGFWTLPAGFMELGETTHAGAARETHEEAGARIEIGPLFSMIDLPHANQVHLFYRATLLDCNFMPGEETLEQRLFSETEIPWDDLAFSSVRRTLELYFADLARGQFASHTETLLHSGYTA